MHKVMIWLNHANQRKVITDTISELGIKRGTRAQSSAKSGVIGKREGGDKEEA